MKKSTLSSVVAFLVLAQYGIAGAMTTYTYQVIRESVTSVVLLICLILALSIYKVLKGGSLGTPWLFFLIGFAVALVGGIIKLMDIFKIVIHVYDLRLADLLTTIISIIFLGLGLYYYRKGLE